MGGGWQLNERVEADEAHLRPNNSIGIVAMDSSIGSLPSRCFTEMKLYQNLLSTPKANYAISNALLSLRMTPASYVTARCSNR